MTQNSSIYLHLFAAVTLMGMGLLNSPPVIGADLSLGVTAVESGNDTFRPGISARLGLGSTFVAEVAVWGRSFGPVTERAVLGTFGGRWNTGLSSTYVLLGLTGLQESTTIQDGKGEGQDLTEVSFAPALGLGTGMTLFRLGSYRMDATWATHVFPAGSNIIMLAHGRKQLITLSGGYDL